MFWLYTFLVDMFQKIRFSINKIITGLEQRFKRYSIKNALCDILSLADQMHKSKSTNSNSPKCEKIYFWENQVPDLLMEGKKYLHFKIHSYNELVEKYAL